MLGYATLESIYTMNFLLLQHHKYSLEEMGNLIPFERDLYLDMLKKHLDDENRRIEQQNNK